MSSKVQVLPRLSVLPDTFRKYKKGYKMFRTWLDTEVWKGHRLMPLTEKELDEALVDWTEYEMDWNPRRGNMQDCARARNMIILLDPSMRLLWHHRAIKGWNRLVPAENYTPMPKGLQLMMIEWFLLHDDLQNATIVALSFEYMCRTPSELLVRQMKEVHLPGTVKNWTGSGRGSISLKKTKKAYYDSITLDANLATELLVEYYKRRRKELKRTLRRSDRGDALLFPISEQSFRRRFKTCLTDLGLPDDHPYKPYSLRHGGTTDMHLNGRSTQDITARGRWKDEKTCNLYISSANANKEALKLPSHLKKKSKKLLKNPMRLLDLL